MRPVLYTPPPAGRRRRSGVAAASLAGVLVAGVLQGIAGAAPSAAATGTAAGASAGGPATAPTEAAASRQAHALGRRVEVLGERTETRQVFANADGTFTSETSALPERVRRGNGWVGVDADLRFDGKGAVRTVATPLDLSFSAGGDGALATMGDGHRSVAVTWPGSLPRPVLDGSTATYPSVLPGVDLKLTASVLGYSETLVVKTREAAANPALARIRFGLKPQGVSVRRTKAGGVQAVDSSGTAVFDSPAPRMWDSSGTARAGAQPPALAPKAAASQAPMRVELSTKELSVVPDAAMLKDPKATFPLYIDPEWSGSKTAWAYVDQAFPSQEYYNSTHTPEAGNYGSGLKRSFFRMDSDNVNGKHILKATFRITQNKSWGCTSSPQNVQLWLTGKISSSTNWSNQPAWEQLQDSVASDAGYSSSCPDKEIEFDATKAVTSAAAGKWSSTTLGLRDYDDTNSSEWGWKGFSASPKLVIDYNTPPSAPTGVGTDPGTPCVTGDGRPHVNAGDSENPIKLKAKIYDPDKANDGVRAEFTMHHLNSATGAWDDITSTLPGGGKTAYTFATSATDHSITAPPLTNGDSYSFKVRAYDGTDASAYSAWCEFTVDTTDPSSLPAVTSTDYPADTPEDWKGGVGLAGGFTLAPGSSDPDVTGFRYALDDPSEATAATQVTMPAGQTSVTVQVAPRHDWLNTLYVYPVDQAGNVGKVPTAYTFYVKAGSTAVGRWRFDETSGTQAADSTSAPGATPHPVTLTGGTGWAAGRVGGGLRMDGTTGYGSTTGPVLDTTRSLSVSAWARLTDNTKNSTIVTQAGSSGSGFQLYYSSGLKRWIFNRHATDTDDTAIIRAQSDQEPQLGVWTHLVGVYDAPAKQLRLYVNGVEQAAPAAFTTPWSATGAVRIGQVHYKGAYSENFAGDLDDVQLWNRVLSDDPRSVNDPALGNEIAAMAKQPPSLQARWDLEETAGTTAADSSGNGRTATLSGAAAWSADGPDGSGMLHLDGTSASAGTTASVVRTDHSYTVTAWVRLPDNGDCTLPDHDVTALSQDGVRQSGFYLGYRLYTQNGVQVPYWTMTMTNSDADTTTWTHANSATPVDCSAVGEWTHLAAIYDEPAHELRLYVGGSLADEVPFTGWNADGPFRIGRSKYRGNPADYWPGDIDGVHVYAGTLTDRQVLDDFMGNPVGG
jgi:Concanavalin A-like lectin/glucanases superfamily